MKRIDILTDMYEFAIYLIHQKLVYFGIPEDKILWTFQS
jgi:hypothetical protein